MKSLDGKFSLDIVNGEPVLLSRSGEIIDVDKEPVFLFRAQDNLAKYQLLNYYSYCEVAGASEEMLKEIDTRIKLFSMFGRLNKTKIPD